jgi:hypothetical protein
MERPYGADEGDAFDKWLKRRGFRYAPRAGCLHWLARGRCSVGYCMDGQSSREWMDHVSGYTKDGERYLLCQPYQLSFHACQSLMETCQEWGFHAWISGWGWYGNGTLCIELEPGTQLRARIARKYPTLVGGGDAGRQGPRHG